MRALVHICDFYEFKFVDFGEEYANASIYKTLTDMAPTLNDTIATCEWQHKETECSELFSPKLTTEGLCFTFNSLSAHEMYSEKYGF